MNEQVEKIFVQMLGTDVPPEVKVLFEKFNFLVNRIDCLVDPAVLCLIAALATPDRMMFVKTKTKPKTAVEKAKEEYERLLSEQGDGYEDITTDNPEPVEDPDLEEDEEDDEEDQTVDEPQRAGPTGPMDVPARQHRRHPKAGALSERVMNGMSVLELRTHAKVVYGWDCPVRFKRPQIVAVLTTKDPLPQTED